MYDDSHCGSCLEAGYYTSVTDGKCLLRSINLTSSRFDQYKLQVQWKFNSDIETSQEPSNILQVVILKLNLDSIKQSVSLKTLSATNDILKAPDCQATSVAIKGDSIIATFDDCSTELKNATAILLIKTPGVIRSKKDRDAVFRQNYLVHSDINLLKTSVDRLLSTISTGASVGVAILASPSAFAILNLLSQLGIYVFIDVQYPTNFETVLKMMTISLMDITPNFLRGLDPEDASSMEVPERFERYSYSAGFFDTCGSFFTLAVPIAMTATIIKMLKKSASQTWSGRL